MALKSSVITLPKNCKIIYLNGPTSSGKTTLAKALQQAFEEPFLHVGIDKIIGWMPEKMNDWLALSHDAPLPGFSWKKGVDPSGHPTYELQMGPYAKKIRRAFLEIARLLATLGHNLILDDFAFGKKDVDEWKALLTDFQVLWVGVNAPLEILESREKTRGNRVVGSARDQFHKIHAGAVYDLTLDTHQSSLGENVAKIQAALG